MAAAQSFLKEAVLKNKFIRPGIVKVVTHIDGAAENGTMVKEITDSVFYMEAIFTKQSLDSFQRSFEDSFSSPLDWSHGLLMLNQFSVEFQPASAPSNTESRPRFVLVVEHFGLHNLHEGFYNKNLPKNIMADADVQAKAKELDTHFGKTIALIKTLNEEATIQSSGDVPVSQLLDQMLQSVGMQESSVQSQAQGQQDGSGLAAPTQEGGNVAYTLQSARARMCCLNCEDFIVSPEQQAVLDSIPEWKDNYIPPASESSEEQSSIPSAGASLDLAFEGPTLQQETGQVMGHPSTAAKHRSDQDVAGLDLNDRPAREAPLGEEEASVGAGKETNSDLTCAMRAAGMGHSKDVAMDDHLQADVESDAGRRLMDKRQHGGHAAAVDDRAHSLDGVEAGKRSTGGGQSRNSAASEHYGSAASEPTADISEASKSSGECSAHHPDVSFTMSSSSNLGDNSSSLGEDHTSPPVNTAHQAAQPSADCQAEDGVSLLDNQEVQQQRQNQGNGPSVQGTVNRPAVSTSSVASEPVPVDRTFVVTSRRTAVLSSKVEVAKKTESSAARVTGCTQKREGCSLTSEKDLPIKQSRSDVVQCFNTRPENEEGAEDEVSASHIFVPSAITSPELVSGSISSETRQGGAACDGHTALPSTQGFVPSDLVTQDFIPDESSCPRQGMAEVRDDDGDEQAVANPVGLGQGSDHTGPTEGGLRVARHPAEGTRKVSLASEKGQHASASQCQQHAANMQDSIGPDSHLVEEPPEFHVYHSTQITSTNSGQSYSVLDLSPIEGGHNVEKQNSISPNDREHQERTETRNRKSHSDRIVSVPQMNRLEEQSTIPPPAKISTHHTNNETSQDSANASRVLVSCSLSSNSEDAFDRDLMQQAKGQGAARTPANVQPESSGETVIVPDSSQEDVIVITSSENSVGEANVKLSEVEVRTVGELYDLVHKPRHTRVEESTASSHKPGVSDKPQGLQSPSKGGYPSCKPGVSKKAECLQSPREGSSSCKPGVSKKAECLQSPREGSSSCKPGVSKKAECLQSPREGSSSCKPGVSKKAECLQSPREGSSSCKPGVSKKAECLQSPREGSSSCKPGVSDKPQSSRAGSHQSRTDKSSATGKDNVCNNMCTDRDIRTTYDGPLKTLKKSADLQDSVKKSNYVRKQTQVQKCGHSLASLSDRRQSMLKQSVGLGNPYTTNVITSDSDGSEDGQTTPSESHKRVRPWDSNHVHLRKRPRQKVRPDVCSHSWKDKPTAREQGDVDISHHDKGPNAPSHTFSARHSRSPRENRQTENASHQKQIMPHFFPRVQLVRAAEAQSRATKAENRVLITQADLRKKTSHAHRNSHTDTRAQTGERASVSGQRGRSSYRGRTDTSSDDSDDMLLTSHFPKGRASRNMSVTPRFPKGRAARNKQTANDTAGNRCSREQIANDTAVNRYSRKQTANDTAGNRCSREHSTDCFPDDVPVSQHSSKKANHSSSAASMDTCNTGWNDRGKQGCNAVERHHTTRSPTHSHTSLSPPAQGVSTSNLRRIDSSDREGNSVGRGQSTSPLHSPIDKVRNSRHSPSVYDVVQPSRTTTGKSTSRRTPCARLQGFESSDTDEERTSESAYSRDEISRVWVLMEDWLKHRARSEDPEQKRLRRLKLTEDMLKKVEECLGRPSK